MKATTTIAAVKRDIEDFNARGDKVLTLTKSGPTWILTSCDHDSEYVHEVCRGNAEAIYWFVQGVFAATVGL